MGILFLDSVYRAYKKKDLRDESPFFIRRTKYGIKRHNQPNVKR